MPPRPPPGSAPGRYILCTAIYHLINEIYINEIIPLNSKFLNGVFSLMSTVFPGLSTSYSNVNSRSIFEPGVLNEILPMFFTPVDPATCAIPDI